MILFLAAGLVLASSSAFNVGRFASRSPYKISLQSSGDDDVNYLQPSDVSDSLDQTPTSTQGSAEATELKTRLLKLAASFDRGFASSPRASSEANDVIAQLQAMNPTSNANRGIDGYDSVTPLKGIWRLIWTSALDVVSLGANPLAAPSAIYQDIRDPPTAVNIIDFIPRVQTLFPPSIAPSTLVRAEVTTRASERSSSPNRVGLVFEGVKLQPIEFFGQSVSSLPPLSVDFTFGQGILDQVVSFVPGLDELRDNEDAPGYFDVDYLDDELLIIRQGPGGGVFALIKVDSCDP
mmetsp:Transcript_21243/g.49887  ORF Transcript_21243/g.49887 Transcript_21243/m.49887 type:complete len:293 (-) Transcript_21243:1004-1882(-)